MTDSLLSDAGQASVEVTEEMVADCLKIFEDWLSEQPYGYESVRGEELIRRVLSQAIGHIQKGRAGFTDQVQHLS